MDTYDRALSVESAESDPAAPAAESGEASLGSVQLRALSRVSAALCGLSDLDAILRVGLDSIFDLLQGAFGGILLLDEETQTLHYRIAHGLSPADVEGTKLKIGDGIAGKVVDTGRVVLLEDISKDPAATKDDLVITEGLKAFVSIPLRAGHRIFGAINVASRIPHHFGKDDIYVLCSIGDQMGIAIERAEVYEQLRKGRETYQRLARHFLLAQEEERRRIARELHDETSQSMSALALHLRALLELAEMSGYSPDFVERVRKVESMAGQTARELSRVINDLRPALLDSVGLVPAIRRFAQDNLQPHGIELSVEATGARPLLPPEVEVALFRFAQGAITNIVRHANAKTVAIALECGPDQMTLRISDDGQGFDVSGITGIEDTGRGRGLYAMRERVSLLGGRFVVDSAPDAGTTVVATVPIGGVDDAQDPCPRSR
jgi:signal transduction histidine kinase